MHTVPVSSGSLPSVALCFPDTTKIDQSKIIRNMLEDTVIQQCYSLSKLRSTDRPQDGRQDGDTNLNDLLPKS